MHHTDSMTTPYLHRIHVAQQNAFVLQHCAIICREAKSKGILPWRMNLLFYLAMVPEKIGVS